MYKFKALNALHKIARVDPGEDEREPAVINSTDSSGQDDYTTEQAVAPNPYIERAMSVLGTKDPSHPMVLELSRLIESQFNRISRPLKSVEDEPKKDMTPEQEVQLQERSKFPTLDRNATGGGSEGIY